MSNGLYDKVYLSNSYVNLKLYENPNPELLRAFKLQESIQESCITRSIAVGIASSLLGVVVGSFMFTMNQSSKPTDINLTTKEVFRLASKDLISHITATSKNFAKIGSLYSLIECGVQKKRGSCDLYNSIYAGCATGATLSYKNGPLMATGSCIAFAAFSGAMEAYQHSTG
ncbi:Mitochondrial import inner membrane translocase subunit tim22 [Babesia microti strain RI]|uniref:Mitochondrial import inner membrane translocase subunit TIM22 n=1 Tax=Babesia microti (strain RI) TaxID=1133968 RepID=A0A1N6LXB5_BABMR|nr:Mitochondrial import inner membrane translocase subunit tim22 [Babesia microti strain RI]SIO73518.1 Mitochondrial import inner membrane translocase subunit tim22 [Babesia microti strain RI]|eukprot:XP_021337610.1 Mitochondrial import inner membrane translocase subunit tim22 [Babesia microti strain RI]